MEKKGHHAFKTEKGKIPVGRSIAELQTPAKLQERKRTFGTKKKLIAQKGALFRAGDKNEIVQNELLVKELALSSDIGGVKSYTSKTRSKKGGIPKRMQRTGKFGEETRNAITGLPIPNEAAQKRTSISLPSAESDSSLNEHDAPMSRTLLTAVGLLLDGRNHFEKDSNALSLAKVLLDNDKNPNAKHTIPGSDSLHTVSHPGGLSHILRVLNASLSPEALGGERKSTIHTELINPTELGISILRLLFGHKAPLVMKPTYKPLFRNNPTSRLSPVANPIVSSSRIRLASQMKQFEKEKGNAKRKHRKTSFSFALAKAVSDLIKSMAKEELKKYLQKMHNQRKLLKQVQYPGIPDRFWPSKKKVDVQGDRKSWVLLKIPKAGEEVVPQQNLADDPLDEKETNEVKSPTGIVDTLGKLNDADPMSLEMSDKNTGVPSRSGVNNEMQKFPSEVKARPTSSVGYKIRILPSLKGSAGKQTDSTRVNETPAKKPQSSTVSTAAFAEAVKKLLQAVQSSIKNLQGKQLIGHVASTESDHPQNSGFIVSDQPPKVAEKTNTGSVRGMTNDPTKINDFQPNRQQPVLEGIQARKQPSLGELSALTRATGQSEPVIHGNALFDPLRDLEMAASEPITKSVSPTKRIGPSENVLFESATELGTTRDKQETVTVKHIQEGTFNISPYVLLLEN